MPDPIPVSKMKVTKLGATMHVSGSMIWDHEWSWKFPRKHHDIVHPVTVRQRREYEAFAKRWHQALADWDAIVAEGVRRDLADGEGGYDYEPPHLHPLEDRVERVYDETDSEWRDRVTGYLDHHAKTDEWLVEPAPNPFGMFSSVFARAFDESIIAKLADHDPQYFAGDTGTISFPMVDTRTTD